MAYQKDTGADLKQEGEDHILKTFYTSEWKKSSIVIVLYNENTLLKNVLKFISREERKDGEREKHQ